jgi:hypothetical protein
MCVQCGGCSYAYCVNVTNEAGITSRERCSDGVVVGSSVVPLAATETTTVMVSQSTPDDFSDAPPPKTLLTLTVPPGAVPRDEVLQGSEVVVSGSGESTVLGTAAVQETRFQFGDRLFSLGIRDYPAGFVFDEPLVVELFYENVTSALLSGATALAPSLLLFLPTPAPGAWCVPRATVSWLSCLWKVLVTVVATTGCVGAGWTLHQRAMRRSA